MQGPAVNADALVGVQADFGFLIIQAEHLSIDAAAFQRHFGKAGFFVGGHIHHGGSQRLFLFARNADAHAGQAVQPLGKVCRTHGIKPPGKPGYNMPGKVGIGRSLPCVDHLLQISRAHGIQLRGIPHHRGGAFG